MSQWKVLLRSVLLLLLVSASAHADVFLYAPAKHSVEEIPARYTGPLPPLLDPDPSYATWRQHLDVWPNGPTHLEQRICRDGAPERDRLLAAMRRAADGPGTSDERFQIVLTFLLNCGPDADRAAACYWVRRSIPAEPNGMVHPSCRAEADRASLCDWMRRSIPVELNTAVRRLLYRHSLGCATPDDAALFTAADAPDMTVVAFLKKYPATDYSNRLEAVVRARARAGEWTNLGYAVEVYGQRDDSRVAATLLELYAAASEPEGRRVLGLALHAQTNPRASEVYSAEWKSNCEQRRAIRAEHESSDRSAYRGLGKVSSGLPTCDVGRRFQARNRTNSGWLSRVQKGARPRDRPISHTERL
ncbi:MAG: hypothetical protein JRE13_17040, partial [Deltaproteobacteria bacterium]|nr:hypothetical protein [Deltaproteobacteria bacterium]